MVDSNGNKELDSPAYHYTVDHTSGAGVRCRLRINEEADNDETSLCIDSYTDGRTVLETVRMLDVIGCSYAETERGELVGFHVHWYPVVTPAASWTRWHRRGKRVRRRITIAVTADDVESVTHSWLTRIRALLHTSTPPPHLRGRRAMVRSRLRYLLLVNPNSGQGRSTAIFQDEVVPMLSEADILCKVVITVRHNHARDLAENLHLDDWDGIVIASGDGLVFEVLNGFMHRSDRSRALRMPLGVLPTGSGNSLAASICYHCCQPFAPGSQFVTEMVTAVCRPLYLPITLVHLQTPTANLASFLSVGWGLMPDCGQLLV